MCGAQAIPGTWLGPLELRGVIEAMADDLATVTEWRLVDEKAQDVCDFYFRRYLWSR